MSCVINSETVFASLSAVVSASSGSQSSLPASSESACDSSADTVSAWPSVAARIDS
eukprot:CAMPEP_0185838640 /NCGR_PEP_ID=MMETSP1353-20130828/13362_1 /TAXON_ID=1077150 /ORGANISM="Erythrolobus australicus, Strain CCMP3124" /LENGTH=55 /DNA_ID=CAMNT_0028537721 /DNA_START=48 /DNA_END=212 /DNA_ORIENTATION=-